MTKVSNIIANFETTTSSRLLKTDAVINIVREIPEGYQVDLSIIDNITNELEYMVVKRDVGSSEINIVSRGINPLDSSITAEAFKKDFPSGSVVKITNFVSLAVISKILNGDLSLGDGVVLKYDTENATTYTLGEKQLVDYDTTKSLIDVAVSGVIAGNPLDTNQIAGENLPANTICRFKHTDGKVYVADKDDDTITEATILVFNKTAVDISVSANISDGVILDGNTGLDVGFIGSVYLGDDGAVSDTGNIQIGKTGADSILILDGEVIRQNIADALKGSDGFSPSDTNRYETQDSVKADLDVMRKNLYNTPQLFTNQLISSDTEQYNDSVEEDTLQQSHTLVYLNDIINHGRPFKHCQILGQGVVKIKFGVKMRSRNTSPADAEIFVNHKKVASEVFDDGYDGYGASPTGWVPITREFETTATLDKFINDIHFVAIGNFSGTTGYSLVYLKVYFDIDEENNTPLKRVI